MAVPEFIITGIVYTRVYPKVSGLSPNEINNNNNNNNKHILRSNTKGYGDKLD
jgi:hypothetical protein